MGKKKEANEEHDVLRELVHVQARQITKLQRDMEDTITRQHELEHLMRSLQDNTNEMLLAMKSRVASHENDLANLRLRLGPSFGRGQDGDTIIEELKGKVSHMLGLLANDDARIQEVEGKLRTWGSDQDGHNYTLGEANSQLGRLIMQLDATITAISERVDIIDDRLKRQIAECAEGRRIRDESISRDTIDALRWRQASAQNPSLVTAAQDSYEDAAELAYAMSLPERPVCRRCGEPERDEPGDFFKAAGNYYHGECLPSPDPNKWSMDEREWYEDATGIKAPGVYEEQDDGQDHTWSDGSTFAENIEAGRALIEAKVPWRACGNDGLHGEHEWVVTYEGVGEVTVRCFGITDLAQKPEPVDHVPLQDSTDAMRWAQEFTDTMKAQGSMTVDDMMGLTLTWFANAIETGRRAGQQDRVDTQRSINTLDTLLQCAMKLIDDAARREGGPNVVGWMQAARQLSEAYATDWLGG